jgi:hypothetical protein
MGMHHIVLQFITYIEKDKDRACQTHSQPEHIKNRKKLLALEVAKRDQ